MLYVTMLTKDGMELGTHEYHVGYGRLPSYRGIIEVQADGDELNTINAQFRDLPHNPGNRVVRWYGDFAKFIAGNVEL